MNDPRYVYTLIVQAPHISQTTYYPIWECTDINFQYGAIQSLILPDGTWEHSPVILEGTYDLKKRRAIPYRAVEFRPKPKYVVGQKVAVEVEHRKIVFKTITEIRDGRCEAKVQKGEEFKRYMEACPEDFQLQTGEVEDKAKYTFRTVYPAYVMNDGQVVEWDHQIYEIEGI